MSIFTQSYVNSNTISINEYIKSTIHIFLHSYCKIFNIVLNSGKFIESWSEGVMFPLFKNKGNTKNPYQYCNIYNTGISSIANNIYNTGISSIVNIIILVIPVL
jgi:hypothetical protein